MFMLMCHFVALFVLKKSKVLHIHPNNILHGQLATWLFSFEECAFHAIEIELLFGF